VLADKDRFVRRENFLPRDPRLCRAQLGTLPRQPPSIQRKQPSCPQWRFSPTPPARR
jgi:hypothetical protein